MRELFGCSTEPAIGDISTNLGQSVSKLATQKVLVACAERGVITSKAYGGICGEVLSQSSLNSHREANSFCRQSE